MKIRIASIYKSKQDEFSEILDEYTKMISRFAQIDDCEIYNKNIEKAQKIGHTEAKNSYSKAFEGHKKGFTIALDECGDKPSSIEFSKILESKNEVTFFIGGSYGFDDGFLNSVDKTISLSPMTFSHRLAKVVLYEQIYRSLSILNNHPYHKI